MMGKYALGTLVKSRKKVGGAIKVVDIYFAAIGDVHGRVSKMLKLVEQWEKENDLKINFILQVGDFEPHRSVDDLRTMDAPSKYKKIGDFSSFYSNQKQNKYPTYFIGGNHEPYGFLDTFPNGLEVAHNFYYLGRVGCIDLSGLRIIGVSGIYDERIFRRGYRYPIEKIREISNSEYIGFTESEINKALEYSYADILLLHEWPQGIMSNESYRILSKNSRYLSYAEVGNEYAKILIELLQPKLAICGHMHNSYRAIVETDSEGVCKVCCLADVTKERESLAVFRVSPDKQIIEVT